MAEFFSFFPLPYPCVLLFFFSPTAGKEPQRPTAPPLEKKKSVKAWGFLLLFLF
ncbi:hypothetical protein SLEP1_g24614 [Rubroshorea leprosula]|uniref:Uncharacterized protein n=1 Tax=Rubroshorea leprosula TaxID=152421 RepID=A0AAV5JQN3_9ROSI|nr:hypothetical protein SLEP1_g24614 [Rubroshorea leprosula]